jgi:hypothetical protein
MDNFCDTDTNTGPLDIIAFYCRLGHGGYRDCPPCREKLHVYQYNYLGRSLIEVANSWPQSSHDQAWSIRPLTLNQDSSATSRTIPQLGHFGRLRSSVARTRVDRAWQADWTIIVDPPRRFFPHRT